eukprot:3758869-Prymnesium_polylepis.1
MLPGKYPRNVPWSEYCQGWCILPDAYSTLIKYVAVVSARHARPTLSCTTRHDTGGVGFE